MKAFHYFISITWFALTAFQNPVRQRFSIQILFESNMTPGVKYFLNQDGIKIFTSSDYRWKRATLVYNKVLTSKQSEVYMDYLEV